VWIERRLSRLWRLRQIELPKPQPAMERAAGPHDGRRRHAARIHGSVGWAFLEPRRRWCSAMRARVVIEDGGKSELAVGSRVMFTGRYGRC